MLFFSNAMFNCSIIPFTYCFIAGLYGSNCLVWFLRKELLEDGLVAHSMSSSVYGYPMKSNILFNSPYVFIFKSSYSTTSVGMPLVVNHVFTCCSHFLANFLTVASHSSLSAKHIAIYGANIENTDDLCSVCVCVCVCVCVHVYSRRRYRQQK